MLLTIFAVLALASSIWITYLTIVSAKRLNLGADEGVGVQKFHSHWVPRLGGLPIFLALTSGALAMAWITKSEVFTTLAFIVCVLPAFGVGLLEDVTRRAGVLLRLVFTMISAALAWWLLDAQLTRLGIPYVDAALGAFWPAAFALTLIAAAGIAHAVNIVDGYNGLSGFLVTVVLLSLAWVANAVNDVFVCRIALLSAASTAGFLCWNWPNGRIFMGDAGAYLLGFMIALLSIMLVVRHPEVSPWFPLLLVMHPVWETLFSMYRRSRYGLSEMGRPDALHLHSLIFRRVVKHYGVSRTCEYRVRRNATTSVYLWIVALLCAVPAIVFWDNTLALMGLCALFAVTYVVLYRKLVRFKVPRVFLRSSKESQASQRKRYITPA